MDSGSIGFVMICAALVFFMTPGLSYFYGGLVRRKNAVNTMFASVITIGTGVVMWVLFGYSLAFGTDHFGIAEYRRTGPQCLQARSNGVMPEHQRVRDARIRRRVDEPPHHAPFWCGKLYVQIAFRLDGPEALALDFLSTQVPTYFHALSLISGCPCGPCRSIAGAVCSAPG